MSIWKRIDSAPRDGTKILVWRPKEEGHYEGRERSAHVGLDIFIDGMWYASRTSQQPTHWMPLPLPPSD